MVNGDGRLTDNKMDDVNEQINKLQLAIQEDRWLLNQGECKTTSRQELKERIENKEKRITELQNQMDNEDGLSLPRRTDRQSKPTEKMQVYQTEELNKREKRLLSLHEQWKIQVRAARETLKKDISDSDLANMADDIENGTGEILKVYGDIRKRVMPSTELRRKIDACEAVTKDFSK